MLKIAFISDVHIGPSGYHKGIQRKLTENAEPYLNKFVERFSKTKNIVFAVQLGDLIQDSDLETDRTNYQKGITIFNKSPKSVHHVVGNHELVNLSTEEIQQTLGLESLYYSFDLGHYHFVILFSHVRFPETPGGIITDNQLVWLQKDLAITNKSTFVFTHQSLADQDLTGNPWFEGYPEDCLVENRVEVRRLLNASGKVAAVVNGHLHWNHVDWHDGIPYITVQSATENIDNAGTPAHAWGVMEIRGKSFTLIQHGNSPFKHQHDFVFKNG